MRRAWGKYGATAIATLSLLAGLVVAAPQASATTSQTGRNNCAAPSQSDCPFPIVPLLDSYTPNTTDVSQTTTDANGQNFIKCTAAVCKGVQSSPFKNIVVVNNVWDVTGPGSNGNPPPGASADTTQSIDYTQRGPTNEITASLSTCQTLAADCTNDNLLNTASVAQKARQRFITLQEGLTPGSSAQTNLLGVTGIINSRANASVSLPISFDQQSLQYTNNVMRAAVNNTASYIFRRDQNENGITTNSANTEKQDTMNAADDGGPGLFGRAELNLVAPSAGSNCITVRSIDNKSQQATSVGSVIQTQGRDPTDTASRVDADGLRAAFRADAVTRCSPTVPDIDMGTPGGTVGVGATWTQAATALTKVQKQLDDLPKIPFIGSGNSPRAFSINSLGNLTTDNLGQQKANAGFVGEVDDSAIGHMEAVMKAGPKTQNPKVDFDFPGHIIGAAQYNCDQNSDFCPGGTVTQSHMAVRNVTTGESFSATDPESPSSTTADVGQTVEYKGTLENAGGGSVSGASLASVVPAGTSFDSCPDCTHTGDNVSWNLGTVPAHTSVSKTFRVKINSGTLPSTSIKNHVTAATSETNFDSNDTTVNVAQPASHAHAAVRNVDTGETFTADSSPSSTNANPGKLVEYRGIFHNAGPGTATGATLVSSVAANTTYVGCSNSCTQSGSSVSWNLGTVAPGAAVARTFQVRVSSSAPSGASISNKFTGDDDQEAAFNSNNATINVPPTLTVKVKIYPANNGTGVGQTPVAMLSQPAAPGILDDPLQIDPSSVCFGKTTSSTTACNGSVQSTTTDLNNDGRPDLKMSFNTLASGVLPTDPTACITGTTFSGQRVQGCGPTK